MQLPITAFSVGFYFVHAIASINSLQINGKKVYTIFYRCGFCEKIIIFI